MRFGEDWTANVQAYGPGGVLNRIARDLLKLKKLEVQHPRGKDSKPIGIMAIWCICSNIQMRFPYLSSLSSSPA